MGNANAALTATTMPTAGGPATAGAGAVAVQDPKTKLHDSSDASEESMTESPLPKSVLIVNAPIVDDSPIKMGMESLSTDETASMVSSVSDYTDYYALNLTSGTAQVRQWNLTKHYSDYIAEGLRYLDKDYNKVVMLFESPSSATNDSSFFNGQVFKMHDYPPNSSLSKAVLGPCRYSLMSGNAFPSYLRDKTPPAGLLEHWARYVPDFVAPTFIDTIDNDAHVYAYLPVESLPHHVNDPHVHYHMVGKDAIPLMTSKTTKLLPNTKVQRPCIVKTTHSMGSKGIFVIRNDEDEAEFEAFLAESGNPTFVVTEYIEISRNIACHCFFHPDGSIDFIGSNENLRDETGKFTSDSYLLVKDQERLRELQLPYVHDVAKYCRALGFWGFVGMDVLFDENGKGYLVDVNPRVTGSCPSIMVQQLLHREFGFEYGMFRRSGNIFYYGTTSQLLDEVAAYNASNHGASRAVLFSMFQAEPDVVKLNLGVYSHSLDECKATLNRFAQPKRDA